MEEKTAPIKRRTKLALLAAFALLAAVFLAGVFWLVSSPAQNAGFALAFAAGLSMIVLPCTFPLVFVLVPLAMGRNPKKGVFMAVLFGAGLIITLSAYGAAVAYAGQIFGLASVSRWMFFIAGAAALVFGLSELGLLKIKIPSYGGAVPGFIQKRGDYLKSFFMGLFLGNAGVACPNPATYVILAFIAGTGDAAYGAALQAANGFGRFLPLLAITLLAVAGVNASGWLARKREAIRKATAWGLIAVGAFISVWGIYGHYWFLNTPLHSGWTRWFGAKVGAGAAEYECCVSPPCSQCLEGKWIFGDGACQCRVHLEKGHLDKVCPECRRGLAEGRGVALLAEKTQGRAFALLAFLILAPAAWYAAKNAAIKRQKRSETGNIKK